MAVDQLGRLTPTDWTHVDKYPLKGSVRSDVLEAKPRPVVIGVNWYEAFDRPVQEGRYWYIKDGPLGEIRGGHCVCLKPRGATEPTSWWEWYDQVSEGICVGEGVSRMASHFNRKRYQSRWLYDECKKVDGYDGEGTWVSVGLDVLRELGHVARKPGEKHWLTSNESLQGTGRDSQLEGISANRWIRSIDDCLQVLGYQDKGYVDVINSWGRGYPKLTRLDVDVLERLWNEDGEIGVATDR